MNVEQMREKLRIILNGIESDGQPVQLAIVFPDGGVTLTIGGKPVAEALAEYLAVPLADLE